jgi:hypothetical protein
MIYLKNIIHFIADRGSLHRRQQVGLRQGNKHLLLEEKRPEKTPYPFFYIRPSLICDVSKNDVGKSFGKIYK